MTNKKQDVNVEITLTIDDAIEKVIPTIEKNIRRRRITAHTLNLFLDSTLEWTNVRAASSFRRLTGPFCQIAIDVVLCSVVFGGRPFRHLGNAWACFPMSKTLRNIADYEKQR